MCMSKAIKLFGVVGVLVLAVGMSANATQKDLSVAPDDSTVTVVSDAPVVPDKAIIDEVIWVVGDEPIMRSDVEAMRMQAEMEGMEFDRDPYCAIPEQLAVQKLYLHQAEIDSIEVTESEIAQDIDMQINHWIQIIGSQEKLEAYRGQSMSEIRLAMHDDFKNSKLVQKMRMKLVEDVTVTPAEVRRYFQDVPADSLPEVPAEVEVQIITMQPEIPVEEINRVKDQLRGYADRVMKGETTFATLARMYSEDPGTARQGGELGFTGRGMLDPAFANVAFNLTDPKRVSKIVESEFGFHIIQLIDKRGDRVNVRHILRKPVVSQAAIDSALVRLGIVANDIRSGLVPFEFAVLHVSDDKDTRSNKGLMANVTDDGRTSRFQMKDLPKEIASVVDTMQVGQVSAPFQMVNSKGKTVCCIIKLRSRIDTHRASVNEDYQTLKAIVLEQRRMEVLDKWVREKIKQTYVRINERYRNCDFQYDGWIR